METKNKLTKEEIEAIIKSKLNAVKSGKKIKK